jgi:hypothetical protein
MTAKRHLRNRAVALSARIPSRPAIAASSVLLASIPYFLQGSIRNRTVMRLMSGIVRPPTAGCATGVPTPAATDRAQP